jgi:hypothetical protein
LLDGVIDLKTVSASEDGIRAFTYKTIRFDNSDYSVKDVFDEYVSLWVVRIDANGEILSQTARHYDNYGNEA